MIILIVLSFPNAWAGETLDYFCDASARSAGTGSAFHGIVGSPTCIYSNSSGLAYLSGEWVGGTFIFGPEDKEIYSLFVVKHDGKSGLAGLLMTSEKTNGREKRTFEFPVIIKSDSMEPFSMDIKYFDKQDSTDGFGLDLNFTLFSRSGIITALSIDNLAVPCGCAEKMSWTFGLSRTSGKNILSVDWFSLMDEKPGDGRISAGMEFLFSSYSLRIGGVDDLKMNRRYLSAGFGNLPGSNLMFDYAYVKDYAWSEKGVHFLSVGYRLR